jgi:phosphomannomutase
LRFVFGYEQALGYLVCDRPRDKDGITAAVLLAEVAACPLLRDPSLAERLDEGWPRSTVDTSSSSGRFVCHRLRASDAVGRLRAAPPDVNRRRDPVLRRLSDYPEAGLLRFVLDGGIRIQVRPSGTEPKVKIYGEGVRCRPDRRRRRDGVDARRMICRQSVAGRSEEAVTSIAEPRHDERLIVEVVVDGSGDDSRTVDVGFPVDALDPLRERRAGIRPREG